MRKVVCITSADEAVVDRDRLFVRLDGQRELVFASQYFSTYRGSYRLIKIPVEPPRGHPQLFKDCLIDWERMPARVTALVDTSWTKKKGESNEDDEC